MEWFVDGISPIPLYRSSVLVTSEEIKTLHSLEIGKNEFSNFWVSKNKSIFDLEELAALKQRVDNHVHRFCYDIFKIDRNTKFDCNGSWFNRFENGGWSGEHWHPNSAFSGVLYVTVGENPGKIVFKGEKHNNLGPFFGFKYTENNSYNSSLYSYEPAFGAIFIFPSSLPHFVESNNSSVRESLAFDYMISGRMDQETNYLIFSK